MLHTLSCYAFSIAVLVTFWIWTYPYCKNVVLITLSFGSATYVCFLLSGIFDHLLPRRRAPSSNKAVFVTGCDSGFGYQLAKRLDSKGYKVFAGCLFPNGPDAQRLKETSSSNLTIIDIDVTSDESVQNGLKNVSNGLDNYELWAIVNNAGILLRGELEWMPLEDYKKQFEVNTFGVVRVTQAFLPLLRKFKGRVVTTTSFGGRYTFTTQAAYCMSKHAVNSFCDALRLEMKKWDIKVITVEPFAYRTHMTDMNDVANSVERTWSKVSKDIKESYGDDDYIDQYKMTVVKFNEMSPCSDTSQVIDCLEEAVTAYSPHYSYSPGDMRSVVGFWFLKRLPPAVAERIITRFITFDADVEKYMKNRRIQKIQYNHKMS